MALSYFGWLNGITAFGIFAFGCVFGFYIVTKSKKLKAKLLTYLGIAIFCSGWAYSSAAFDFLTILFTGRNMVLTTLIIVNMLAWFAMVFAGVFYFYIGARLVIKEKWKYYFIPLSILAGIIEIFIIFYHTSSINIVYPSNMGEDLFYSEINTASPLFITGLFSILLLFELH